SGCPPSLHGGHSGCPQSLHGGHSGCPPSLHGGHSGCPPSLHGGHSGCPQSLHGGHSWCPPLGGVDSVVSRSGQPWTLTPIERAVPSTILAAASTSLAFRSGIFVVAISRTWSAVRVPTLSVCGAPDPFLTPA